MNRVFCTIGAAGLAGTRGSSVVTISGADQLLQPTAERARSHVAYVVLALSDEKTCVVAVSARSTWEHSAGVSGDDKRPSAHATATGSVHCASWYRSMSAPVSR